MKQLAVVFLYLLYWIHNTVQIKSECTECGQCRDDSPCSTLTCTCPNGCKKFWIGDACDKEITPIPESYVNCSWVKAATSTSLEIGWCQIQDLAEEFSSFYGYLLVYTKQGSNEHSKGPIIGHLSNKKIQTAVLNDLEPHTEYDITIWPYRTSQREYDYGRKYDTIIGSTTDQEKESIGCSSLPWILFGMACLVISCLAGVIVALYVTYIRRRKTYTKSTKRGVDNAVGTRRRPDQEISMSSSSPICSDDYLTTTRTADCNEHSYQHLVTQTTQNMKDNQQVYDKIQF